MASTPVLAGGLGLLEIGTSDLGLAGAGYAARAQDAGTAFTNPAGMTRIKGNDFVLGTQLLYGREKFSPNGNTAVPGNDGGNDIGFFPAGGAFYVRSISNDVKLGLAMAGNFGLGLKWNEGWVGRYAAQEGTLLGMNIMPSIAFRASDKLSLAVGANAMLGYVNTKTKINNAPLGGATGDGEVKYKDFDWGFGGTLGALYELSPQTRFGATYSSRIKLGFADQPRFSNLGNIGTVLQAAGLTGAQLQLGMKVPQMVMTSAYHELDDKWAVMGNVGWQQWSKFGNIEVSVASTAPTSLTTDSRYKNTWHTALGAQYQYSSRWQLSGGVGYDSNVTKGSVTSLVAPLGSFWSLGLGAKYKVRDGYDVSFGYTLRYYPDLKIDQSGPAGIMQPRVAGEYKNPMLHFFGATFHWN